MWLSDNKIRPQLKRPRQNSLFCADSRRLCRTARDRAAARPLRRTRFAIFRPGWSFASPARRTKSKGPQRNAAALSNPSGGLPKQASDFQLWLSPPPSTPDDQLEVAGAGLDQLDSGEAAAGSAAAAAGFGARFFFTAAFFTAFLGAAFFGAAFLGAAFLEDFFADFLAAFLPAFLTDFFADFLEVFFDVFLAVFFFAAPTFFAFLLFAFFFFALAIVVLLFPPAALFTV